MIPRIEMSSEVERGAKRTWETAGALPHQPEGGAGKRFDCNTFARQMRFPTPPPPEGGTPYAWTIGHEKGERQGRSP
jgi:hypothetical protein